MLYLACFIPALKTEHAKLATIQLSSPLHHDVSFIKKMECAARYNVENFVEKFRIFPQSDVSNSF
jgi:hypothetical protein